MTIATPSPLSTNCAAPYQPGATPWPRHLILKRASSSLIGCWLLAIGCFPKCKASSSHPLFY